MTFHKNHEMVGQKFWFLKLELLYYQQKTINKPSYGFDRFFPVVVSMAGNNHFSFSYLLSTTRSTYIVLFIVPASRGGGGVK